MLDWSKYKTVGNKLYSPQVFSAQTVILIGYTLFTCIYWHVKDIDRFLVEALMHAFVVALMVSVYVYDLRKYGKYGIPLIEITRGTIILREAGRFNEKNYDIGPEDGVSIVGDKAKRFVRIERPSGEIINILYIGFNRNEFTSFIHEFLSDKRSIVVKNFPIEPI